jgi:hypothetical protein
MYDVHDNSLNFISPFKPYKFLFQANLAPLSTNRTISIANTGIKLQAHQTQLFLETASNT